MTFRLHRPRWVAAWGLSDLSGGRWTETEPLSKSKAEPVHRLEVSVNRGQRTAAFLGETSPALQAPDRRWAFCF